MDTNRIREIHKGTAYPESRSVYQALLQVWNECEQENQMNKSKPIDADKLKKSIDMSRLFNSDKLIVKNIIDELLEEREDVVCGDRGVKITLQEECPNCRDVSGFYLGTTCYECNRPFRDVKTEIQQPNPLKVAIKGDGDDDANGIFIECLGTGRIVYRTGGKEYKQTLAEFIVNCK